MLTSRVSMMSGTNTRRGIPTWKPPILQAVSGDSSGDNGRQSEKGLHYGEALHKW